MTNHHDSDAAFYMARQPICDRNQEVVAYELLYRKGAQAGPIQITQEDELVSLSNVLMEVGLDRLAGNKRAFVNIPESLLGSEAIRLLPPRRVTLEVLEDTDWSAEVERNIVELKELGFQVALDDYIFEPRHEPFLNVVDLVKVDILGVPEAELMFNLIRSKRPGQVFLAEKVETQAQFELCRKAGFQLFQGYFFSKPKTIRGSGVRTNQSLSMSLLARLQDPALSMHELEALIVGDVSLCHKVLRLVNCVANGLTKKVDSIQQALIFLGMAKIRTVASLAVISSIPGKPSELYRLAMIRGRMCETAARFAGFDGPEKHFTVGLFSVLDALTDLPMDQVLAELPLSPDIIEALVGEEEASQAGQSLRYVLQVEHGGWSEASRQFDRVPREAYSEAVEWARAQESTLAA